MKNITHFEKVSFEQFQKDILKNTKIKNKINSLLVFNLKTSNKEYEKKKNLEHQKGWKIK